MLKPVFTEKSLQAASAGRYTFSVEVGLNKFQIKKAIEDAFKVKVSSVAVTKKGSELKRSARRGTRLVLATKKAIVTLSGDARIDIFEAALKESK